MGSSHSATILAVAALAWGAATPASAQQKVLRIAMTAADVPTTTGMPNNGFDGMRFLGFPVLEGAVPVGPLARRPARRAPGSPNDGTKRQTTRRPGSSTCARASRSKTARPSTRTRWSETWTASSRPAARSSSRTAAASPAPASPSRAATASSTIARSPPPPRCPPATCHTCSSTCSSPRHRPGRAPDATGARRRWPTPAPGRSACPAAARGVVAQRRVLGRGEQAQARPRGPAADAGSEHALGRPP